MPTALEADPGDWRDPWYAIPSEQARAFERELSLELSGGHVLQNRAVRAIGRRNSTDDVVFLVDEPPRQLAVVHLTWSSKPELEPVWPMTQLFASWDEFVAEVMGPRDLEY